MEYKLLRMASLTGALLISTAALADGYPQLTVSGLVEVEAFSAEDYDGTDTTDVVVATVELGFDAQVAERVDAHVLVLYEEDDTDPPVIDEATVAVGFAENAYVLAGKGYLPFGYFETHMVSDPLTLEMSETGETVLAVGIESETLYGSIYAFNGDAEETGSSDDDSLVFGGALGAVLAEQLDIGFAYTSNFADSDALQELDGGGAGAAGDVADRIGGLNLYAIWSLGPWTVIGEHVRAMDDYRAGDFNGELGASAQPSASHFELAYAFENGVGVAATYQASDEAAFIGLPESRVGVAVAYDIRDNTSLAFEYTVADDYSIADGGTGEDANSFVLQLAVSF